MQRLPRRARLLPELGVLAHELPLLVLEGRAPGSRDVWDVWRFSGLSGRHTAGGRRLAKAADSSGRRRALRGVTGARCAGVWPTLALRVRRIAYMATGKPYTV